MSHALSLQSRSYPAWTTRSQGGAVNDRARKSLVARELVSDSRVLIEHARLLIHNSTSRIERVEKTLQDLVEAIEAAATGGGPAGKRLSTLIARWLDRREAA